MPDEKFYAASHDWQAAMEQAEQAMAKLRECGGSHLYKGDTAQALKDLAAACERLEQIHWKRS